MPVSDYLFDLNDSVSRQHRWWFRVKMDEKEPPYSSGRNSLLLSSHLTRGALIQRGKKKTKTKYFSIAFSTKSDHVGFTSLL